MNDIDETRVNVVVICPKCGKAERAELVAEALSYMTKNSDGTYTDEVGCAECEA